MRRQEFTEHDYTHGHSQLKTRIFRILITLLVRKYLSYCTGVLVAPGLNCHAQAAGRAYAAELFDPDGASPRRVGFTALTLEALVATMDEVGATAEAAYLSDRYLDLAPVLALASIDPPDELVTAHLPGTALTPSAQHMGSSETPADQVLTPLGRAA